MSSETQYFPPIKLVDVELSEPIASVSGLQGYSALHGLVRLHGAPLGWAKLPIVNGTVSAGAISRAVLEQFAWPIVRHLAADGLAAPLGPGGLQLADLLHAQHPQYAGTWPSVTVAVCTRERPDDLARCLEALVQLDYPNLELLVIDNAPKSDATRAVVARFAGVRYVLEPRPGLSWARNRAIAEAAGELVAYTDDDVIVDRGWVRALAQVFAEHPEVQAVTGLVVPFELESESQLLFERHGGFSRGFDRTWHRLAAGADKQWGGHHGAGKFGTGANMAFRRTLFGQIGTFDVMLGAGTPSNGGEDLDIFFRVLHEGHTLVYEPNALVRHRHRQDYASLRFQIANNGVALFAYYVRNSLAYPNQRGAFVRLARWWLWRWHIKRLLKSFVRPQRFPRDLIVAELWGCVVGLTRYQRGKRVARRIARQYGNPAARAAAGFGEAAPPQ